MPRLENANCIPNHPYMVSAASCSPQESDDQGTGADWRAETCPLAQGYICIQKTTGFEEPRHQITHNSSTETAAKRTDDVDDCMN